MPSKRPKSKPQPGQELSPRPASPTGLIRGLTAARRPADLEAALEARGRLHHGDRGTPRWGRKSTPDERPSPVIKPSSGEGPEVCGQSATG